MGESGSFSVKGGEEFLAVRRLVGQLAKSDLVRVISSYQSQLQQPNNIRTLRLIRSASPWFSVSHTLRQLLYCL